MLEKFAIFGNVQPQLQPHLTMLTELEQADVYVIGRPMHNFCVHSVLKLWIDQIARVGRTFSYSEKGPKGLIAGKRVWIFSDETSRSLPTGETS